MWEVTLALLVVAVCLWVIWRRRRFAVLRNLGIPGPEPSFLFGNLWEISSKTHLVCEKEWLHTFGDIFGYYFGTYPVVVVANLDMLKKIQVSDFQNFVNRPVHFGLRSELGAGKRVSGDGFSSSMINLRDKRWKEIRSTLTPSFTTAKLKMMHPIINDAIDALIENIAGKAQKGKEFDIYEMYQRLTMDVIGRIAFGVQTNCQRNPNDPLLRTFKTIFSSDIRSILQILMFSFPEFKFLIRPFNGLYLKYKNRGRDPVQDMLKAAKGVIKSRREHSSFRRPDLLQIMMDTQVDESGKKNITSQDLTAGNDHQKESDKQRPQEGTEETASKLVRYMADSEIVDNALLFFLAGYETTSTALAFVTHFLLHYPEVQERVREEVNGIFEKEGKLDYLSVQQLQYLDSVFTESLRLLPPVFSFVSREAGQDVLINGLHLPKGITVQVPVFNIQRYERYWPEPDKFDPDRFSPENKSQNHPLAYQVFGAGPRNCVGLRIAQMEAKMALARILQNYRLEKCAKTDELDLPLKMSTLIMHPRNGIYLRAVPLYE